MDGAELTVDQLCRYLDEDGFGYSLREDGITIILVTHDMRLAAQHCQEVLVMHEGRVLTLGPTREVFCRLEDLAQAQLEPPQVARLAHQLALQGMPGGVLTIDEFVEAYVAMRTRRRGPE